MALLVIANLLCIRRTLVYGVLGVPLWLAFHSSGIHPTLAGLLLALAIPARCRIDEAEFARRARRALDRFDRRMGRTHGLLVDPAGRSAVHALAGACEKVESPLHRLEHALQPWVSFVIMPIFATANAGVSLGEDAAAALLSPVALGIALGLVVGKQLGVCAATWAAVGAGAGQLPKHASWRQVYGASWLAGIGFTMSLFIAGLAFENRPDLLQSAKIGILAGSAISGVVGYLILRGKKAAEAAPN